MREIASGQAGPSLELEGRLAALRAQHPGADPTMVADVVRAVLATMRGDLSPVETSLLGEVEELGRVIESAKAEIAALRVDDITASHIPLAADELDAIVAHTAAATDSILETCETLDSVAGDLGAGATAARVSEAATQLQDATTRIYEACGFQDITGQRITKVVAALKQIETKVAHITAAFGDRIRPPGMPAPPPLEPQASLLNGPQLSATAMGQNDIDALLASFD